MITCYDYVAYGLTIRSDILLGAYPCDVVNTPEVTIELEQPKAVVFPPTDALNSHLWFFHRSTLAESYWRGIGRAVIEAGHRIRVTPDAADVIDPLFLTNFVTRNALPLAVFMQGHYMLHASAIAIGDKAVAFIGISGAGKSTTATALLRNPTLRLVTDDMLRLDILDETVWAVPAVPQIKLSSQAAAILIADSDQLPFLQPGSSERTLMAAFTPDTLPLAAIYHVMPSDRFAIEPIAGYQERLSALLAGVYTGVWFKTDPRSHREALRAHLQRTSQIVERVPIRRLYRSRDFDSIDILESLIADDLRL